MNLTVEKNMLSEFKEQFAKLCKYAVRMSLPEPTYEVGDTYSTTVKFITENADGEGNHSEREYSVEVCDIVIDSVDMFKFNGWELVATVNYKDGFVDPVDIMYDAPAPLGLNYDKCDHCKGTHHSRKRSFILEQEEKTIQVGSTCVKQFLGISPEVLLSLSVKFVTILRDFGFDDDEFGMSGGGGSWRQRNNMREIMDSEDAWRLAVTVLDKDNWEYVKKEYYQDGYRNIRVNEGKATTEKMIDLWNKGSVLRNEETHHTIRDLRKRVKIYADSLSVPMIRIYDTEVRGMVDTDIEDVESFEYKLKELTSAYRLRLFELWAIPFAIVQTIKFEEERKVGELSEHIGTINDKIELFAGIRNITTGESDWGTWTAYDMVTSDGKLLQKYGVIDTKFVINDTDPDEIKVGHVIHAMATVKAHKETKSGVPYTQLGRLSMVKKSKKK